MSEGIQVRRAGRGDLVAIAALVRKATRSRVQVDEGEVMEWLFSKGLWVAVRGDALVGVVAHQTENLVSMTDTFFVSPAKLRASAGARLLDTIEAEANTLMCEVNIILLPTWTPKTVRAFLQRQGYEPKPFPALHRIWREVLGDFIAAETELMVKRLRERMIMRPL